MDKFAWVKIYMELATTLLKYKNNRKALVDLLQDVFAEVGMKFPYVEDDAPVEDIDPFTVMGSFNRGITNDNRVAILNGLKNRLALSEEVPEVFDGIPVLNNLKAWFFAGKKDRAIDDIQNLWDMFEIALSYADEATSEKRVRFITQYDKVTKQKIIRWNLTMGMYWCRPNTYINLDDRNRKFILQKDNLPPYFSTVFSGIDKTLPDGSKYLFMCEQCANAIKNGNFGYDDLPKLSYMAWKSTQDTGGKKSNAEFLKWFRPLIEALKDLGGSAKPKDVRDQIAKSLKLSEKEITETRGKTKTNKFANEVAFARNYLAYEGIIDKSQRGVWTLTDKGMACKMTEQMASDIFLKWVDILKNTQNDADNEVLEDPKTRFWMYAAGENSRYWDEFYENGIMAIGWDNLGNLLEYADRTEMIAALQDKNDSEKSFKNISLATWQFSREIKVGDIVYVKRGQSKIVGRGIVQSDYIYDASRTGYKNIRKVEWTDEGEWEHPGKAALKTLTDITDYTDYVLELEKLFAGEETVVEEQTIQSYTKYTEEDFLNDVFMSREEYERLARLLLKKKNIILQGAPGVGKTYAAKRLAYSIMQVKDAERVMMVQFHQSYSYEDFIMGFRPTKEGGFELVPGPFYEFCRKAKDDAENEYFFIIDEINRGNMSKIFGELLMLIESDKRGETLRLLYKNELFSVPANVHIIGMMNTADRSLAIIDYALRRRFAFYEMQPAFDEDSFNVMHDIASNAKYDAIIDEVSKLNQEIKNDDSLGSGFVIGHSYFCVTEKISDEDVAAIVEYELLPLIREYWFDEPSKVDTWTERLRGVVYEQNKD
ncbi:5-methylcytosine-specific restriction enzyme B [Lachnospiraceae bacterium XBB1006]|nr:5-methylcytosine-specific restriction enzyme B [Lachnospiraceae bacterium XBB1006]